MGFLLIICEAFVRLIISILVIFYEYVRLFCAALPGLWVVGCLCMGHPEGNPMCCTLAAAGDFGEWNYCCDMETLDAGRRDLLSKTRRGDGYCVC